MESVSHCHNVNNNNNKLVNPFFQDSYLIVKNGEVKNREASDRGYLL